jgi:retron-type reverse transcriptase
MEMKDGKRVVRERGTPQGGVVSPVLANLFFHYTFDTWMRREMPGRISFGLTRRGPASLNLSVRYH